MHFERHLSVDEFPTCTHLSTGSCIICATCVVCRKSLGRARFSTFIMDDEKTELFAHDSCLDCPNNQRRTLYAEWKNPEMTTFVIKLDHVVSCSCGNFACNSCHLPFGYRLDYVQVHCINKLEFYHFDCLENKTCQACGKGANLTGYVMVKTEEGLKHPHCVV